MSAGEKDHEKLFGVCVLAHENCTTSWQQARSLHYATIPPRARARLVFFGYVLALKSCSTPVRWTWELATCWAPSCGSLKFCSSPSTHTSTEATACSAGIAILGAFLGLGAGMRYP